LYKVHKVPIRLHVDCWRKVGIKSVNTLANLLEVNLLEVTTYLELTDESASHKLMLELLVATC